MFLAVTWTRRSCVVSQGMLLPRRASPPQDVCGGACVCLTRAGLGAIDSPCARIPAQRGSSRGDKEGLFISAQVGE